MDAALEAPPSSKGSALQVRRLTNPSARDTLARLGQSDLAGQGKLTLISLETIAATLGQRWLGRSTAVYEHVERGLERLLSPDAVFLRISQTDYLIAQPSQDEAAAQGFCLRFMRETLRHFLGDDRDADVAVLAVRRLGPDGLEAAPIDRALLVRHANLPMRAAEPRAVPPEPDPLMSISDELGDFATSDGRQLRVDCRLERIINLKTYDDIGLLVTRSVSTMLGERLNSRQVAGLCRADLEKIDHRSLTQGVTLVRSEPGRPFAIGLPLSYTSLGSMRGRAMVVAALRQARALAAGGLFAALYNVEGAPLGPLLTTIALLRPHTLKVFASLGEVSKVTIGGLKDTGVDGLGLRCPNFTSDADFTAWTNAVMTEARRVSSVVALYNLASERRAAIAASLGVTHGGLALDRS